MGLHRAHRNAATALACLAAALLPLAGCEHVTSADAACDEDAHCPAGMHCAGLRCAPGARSPLAVCTRSAAGFSCACPAGYAGDGVRCDDADECLVANGGCDPHALCTNTAGSRTCACRAGWRGDGEGCTDVDECAEGTAGCDPRAHCANTPGASACTCRAGWAGTGRTCTDVDECAAGNGGCDPHALCTNTEGARTCACAAGWQGDGESCTDVDECASGNGGCDPHAACTNTPGSRTCACRAGWRGTGAACADVDECAEGLDDCHAQADCTNTPGSFACRCRLGWAGDGRSCRSPLRWLRQLGTAGRDEVNAIVFANNSLVAAGTTGGSLGGTSAGLDDVFVARLEPDDGRTSSLSQHGSGANDTVRAMVGDGAYVRIAGNTWGALDGHAHNGGADMYLATVEVATTAWLGSALIGTASSDYVEGIAPLGDTTGLAAVGSTLSATPVRFAAKWSWNGVQQWRQPLAGAGTIATAVASTVFDFVVAGETADSLDGANAGGRDAFVQRRAPGGDVLWTHQLGSAGIDVANAVAGANDATIWVGGQTTGLLAGAAAGGNDSFLAHLSEAGEPLGLWQSGTAAADSILAVAVDSDGVFAAGRVTEPQSSTGADVFVRAFDAHGAPLWEWRIGSAEEDEVRALAINHALVCVAGRAGGALPGATSAGGADGFVACLNR